ncbi:cytochrome c1, heme protein, mitochondrial [Drosophila miranda]|uniref:cytochrome c1, heme protein, mitochondrial n=1 Tax=Drosophila miranda TaxID=7229 RepID=UPI0007E7A458|nr:cytochrome c1, heme protein, mitochondrial [Drosophila miranda]
MANKFGHAISKLMQLSKGYLKRSPVRPKSRFSAPNWIPGRSKWLAFGALTGGLGALLYALDASVDASHDCVHPPKQFWNHKGLLSALDKEAVRRGYQVYKEVCSSCHSLQYIAYRNLVNNCMTEAEAKAQAEQVMVKDGPDENGEYFERPGKLSDYLPSPYPNEDAARSANNGAYPPDLSYIVSARKGGEDYIFALLTGYCDPPAGFVLRDGQYFNPYFSGGAISMGQVINNEVVTYADEEVAPSGSQIAKDVVTFLKWTSEPESDERKLLLIRVFLICSFLIGLSYYIKRHKWSALKSRKIFYVPEVNGNGNGNGQSKGNGHGNAKAKTDEACPKHEHNKKK